MRLESDHFYLRTLTQSDVSETYLKWLNDPQINRFLEVRHTPQTLDSLRSFVSSFDGKSRIFLGLFDKASDRHIGNYNIHWDQRYQTVYYGYLIGERDFWGAIKSDSAKAPVSAATEATCMVLDFAFEKLEARKVWGSAYATNFAAIFNLQKFGFTHEGTQRKQYRDGEKWVDSLLYGIFKEEWLESRTKFKDIERKLIV